MSEIDSKFVPSAALLSTVGIKAADVKTDAAIYRLIENNRKAATLAENQISVAVYILHTRGHAYEDIAAKTGSSVVALTKFKVEGAAILRTGEVTRTVSAIRTGSLSAKLVDEITTGSGSAEDKIDALEVAGLASHIKGKYAKADGDITATDFKALKDALAVACEAAALPVTAQKMAVVLPNQTEALGLKVKQREPQVNTDGPLGLEANLKRALADMQAIAKAADDKYVPTPQDVAALMAICEYIDIPLMLSESMLDAVDALLEF